MSKFCQPQKGPTGRPIGLVPERDCLSERLLLACWAATSLGKRPAAPTYRSICLIGLLAAGADPVSYHTTCVDVIRATTRLSALDYNKSFSHL